jgi:hypothetical protein
LLGFYCLYIFSNLNQCHSIHYSCCLIGIGWWKDITNINNNCKAIEYGKKEKMTNSGLKPIALLLNIGCLGHISASAIPSNHPKLP